jgi:hypothetical protein
MDQRWRAVDGPSGPPLGTEYCASDESRPRPDRHTKANGRLSWAGRAPSSIRRIAPTTTPRGRGRLRRIRQSTTALHREGGMWPTVPGLSQPVRHADCRLHGVRHRRQERVGVSGRPHNDQVPTALGTDRHRDDRTAACRAFLGSPARGVLSGSPRGSSQRRPSHRQSRPSSAVPSGHGVLGS